MAEETQQAAQPATKHKFIVRAEIRYVLTHTVSEPDGGSVGTLAEFRSIKDAEMVARALARAHPGAELDIDPLSTHSRGASPYPSPSHGHGQ